MFCSNCGEKLDDGTKFCLKCGAKVDGSAVDTSAKPITPQPQINAMSQETNQQPQQPSTMKNAKVYKITGLICIILGCLGTGVGVVHSAINVLVYTIPMAALGFYALNKAKKLQKTR